MQILGSKILWRISNYHSLSGKGGLLYSGRWHFVGTPVVYLAESVSAALLEKLVHLEVLESEIPLRYTLLKISLQADVAIEDLDASGVEWRAQIDLTRSVGDEWLRSMRTALASVPSALTPHTRNYLLNPMHSDAKFLEITESIQEHYDSRLLRRISP